MTSTTKTVLNVKIDADLKREAQALAKSIGLPISTVVNNLLKKFTEDRSITFEESLVPNTRTRKLIDEACEDYKAGRNIIGTFDNAKDFITSLKS